MCSPNAVIAFRAAGLYGAWPDVAVAVSFSDGVASHVHTAYASTLPALTAIAILHNARKPWTCDPVVGPVPRPLRCGRGPSGVSHPSALKQQQQERGE